MPQQISFVGNAKTPLMHVDNVDVGYRLKSWRSNFVLRHSDLLGVVGGVLGGQVAPGGAAAALGRGQDVRDFMARFQGSVPQSVFDAYAAMSPDERQAFLAGAKADGNALITYYALKYGILYEPAKGEYYLGTTVAEDPGLQDGHRHKATPAEQWSVAAFANLIGKREYTTMFGTEAVAPRLTVNFGI